VTKTRPKEREASDYQAVFAGGGSRIDAHRPRPGLAGCRPDIRAAARQRLRGTLYQPHATIMLRERANGLQAAGCDNEATITRVGLAWDDLDQSEPGRPAGFALTDGTRPGVQLALSPTTERVLLVANTAVWRARRGLRFMCKRFEADTGHPLAGMRPPRQSPAVFRAHHTQLSSHCSRWSMATGRTRRFSGAERGSGRRSVGPI
jgi:hypothetical protein